MQRLNIESRAVSLMPVAVKQAMPTSSAPTIFMGV
jgi:hypothetical protein